MVFLHLMPLLGDVLICIGFDECDVVVFDELHPTQPIEKHARNSSIMYTEQP